MCTTLKSLKDLVDRLEESKMQQGTVTNGGDNQSRLTLVKCQMEN